MARCLKRWGLLCSKNNGLTKLSSGHRHYGIVGSLLVLAEGRLCSKHNGLAKLSNRRRQASSWCRNVITSTCLGGFYVQKTMGLLNCEIDVKGPLMVS